MADNNLPPPHDEETDETILSDASGTRPNPRAPQADTEQNKKHRTKMVRRATPKPPTGHVQARQSPPASYAPRPRRNRRAPSPKDSALYLPWWSIVIMLIGVLVVSFGILGAIYFMGSSNPFSANPDPIIVIVTGDPSTINSDVNAQGVVQAPSTEIISGQNAPTDLQLAGPTLAPVQLSPTPAAIRIGSVVVVEGVDVNTLNVRSTASLLESSVLFRAEEGEIFNVLDGPQQSDGFTWWEIQDPSDVNRRGWAVSNFLRVQAP
ncbi:MAG: hypothetical protein AAFV93_18630 [Chloroflexota bacterium]